MANRPSDELDEGLERRGRLEDFEQVAVVPAPKAAPAPPATKATAKAKAKVKAEDVDIDPNKFLTAKPLRSTAPVTELGDDEDEEIDQEVGVFLSTPVLTVDDGTTTRVSFFVDGFRRSSGG